MQDCRDFFPWIFVELHVVNALFTSVSLYKRSNNVLCCHLRYLSCNPEMNSAPSKSSTSSTKRLSSPTCSLSLSTCHFISSSFNLRSPARTTSLADWKRPALIFSSTKSSKCLPSVTDVFLAFTSTKRLVLNTNTSHVVIQRDLKNFISSDFCF